MSKYFLSPTTETDLDVVPDVLKQALRERWRGVQIEDIGDGNRLFIWTYTGSVGLVEGHLDRTRQVAILDGDVRDCAEFAQWYRSLIDEKYELAFYDDSYSHSVPIKAATQTRDLASAWL